MEMELAIFCVPLSWVWVLMHLNELCTSLLPWHHLEIWGSVCLNLSKG